MSRAPGRRTKPFSTVAAALLAAAGACTGAATADAVPPGTSIVIHAGQLLSDPREPPLVRGTLVVVDGAVQQVQRGWQSPEQLGLEGSSRLIDLSRYFVMPGFIDLHVHLSSAPGDQRLEALDSDASLSLFAARNAQRTLLAGFTTVRDLGSRGDAVFALRDAIAAGDVAGPRIFAAGAEITPTGGHGDVHGYHPDVAAVLASPGVCDGAADCQRAVREAVARGADVIKVTATGGVLSNTAAGTGLQFTPGELQAIVDTAHALGCRVAVHAHAREGIVAALEAGADSIEHAMWADERVLRLFVERGAWLVPTVYPITYVGDTREKLLQGPYKDAPPAILEKLLKLGHQPREMTRLAHARGVRIALGTDSGVSPHGDNAREFLEYVAIGMTPREALATGTVAAAEAGGFERLGRLEPGMIADVVALAGSPLDDIEAVLKVVFVMRDGIVFREAAP